MESESYDVTRVNLEQVRTLLGVEDLRRLIDRLRKKMSRGGALTGKIQLSDASPRERSAIDKLMGRLPTQGNSLSIDLDKLAQILVHAQACESLEVAVFALVGPIPNERLASVALEDQWEQFWRASIRRMEGTPAALKWIHDLQSDGLLKRIAAQDVSRAEVLFNHAATIVDQVPFPGVRLAELAATITGNSHSLDLGQPLASLVIRFARQLDETCRWKVASERRDAWELLGVLSDEVSAPVLVLNLRADTESLTGQALNLHAEAGEPYRISIRQLRHHPPTFNLSTCGPEVFVCENPTVVDVAANRLGSACHPLICIDGQPKTASRLLLDALVKAGMKLRYHGDFDWDGIRIGNTIMRRHGASSWRFETADYAVAAPQTHYSLNGMRVVAEWDPNLATLMEQVGKCVHEEHVLQALLADLA